MHTHTHTNPSSVHPARIPIDRQVAIDWSAPGTREAEAQAARSRNWPQDNYSRKWRRSQTGTAIESTIMEVEEEEGKVAR